MASRVYNAMLPLGDTPLFRWTRSFISTTGVPSLNQASASAWYKMLEQYYLTNGLYDSVMRYALDESFWTPAMSPLRNPAYRVVEIYVSKIWAGTLPGALQIETKNPSIVDPIHNLWKWSRWNAKKQLFIRWLTLFGDGIIKISTLNGRVILQVIKPEHVTELQHGFDNEITTIRIDIPTQERMSEGLREMFYHTEIWNIAEGGKLWFQNTGGPKVPVEQLGEPSAAVSMLDFGFDFLPFEHAQFKDVGENRGLGVFVPVLDKIDEANRMVTRLHQMLFRYNKPTIVVSANQKDAAGRPLPAPRIDGKPVAEGVDFKDDEVIYLPGMSSLDQLIPKLSYGEALQILEAHIKELEKDLPELAYYKLRDSGRDITGRAAKLLLADALDKLLEARGIAEDTLSRAQQKALAIGQFLGIFSVDGDYYSGDFNHTFMPREIVPVSENEKAEAMRAGTQAGAPVATMARRVGWSEDDIERMYADREAELELDMMELEETTRILNEGDTNG